MHDASITVILALGAAVWPVLYGFSIWQFGKVFLSKETFEEYKRVAGNERLDMKNQITDIGGDVKILLQRTSHLNHNRRQEDDDERNS